MHSCFEVLFQVIYFLETQKSAESGWVTLVMWSSLGKWLSWNETETGHLHRRHDSLQRPSIYRKERPACLHAWIPALLCIPSSYISFLRHR